MNAQNPNTTRLVGARSMWPWILGLLALVVAAGIGASYYANDKFEIVDKTPEMRQQEELQKQQANAQAQVRKQADDQMEAQNDAVKSLSNFFAYNDKAGLTDKAVTFSDVKVQRVINDRSFWVGNEANQSLLVMLAPALDTGAAEQAVKVKVGQELDLKGHLRAAPATEDMKSQWGLSATEIQSVQANRVYLMAENIDT